MRPVAERLAEKLKPAEDGCLVWQACVTKSGYGKLSTGPRSWSLAHRVAWELKHGKILDGLVVRHMCHNRRCCNPEHMLLGTNADNTQDKIDAGLMPYGEGHPATKHSLDVVEKIRALYATHTAPQLADMFGMSRHHVYSIVYNKVRKFG